jgi:hypothetical protein
MWTLAIAAIWWNEVGGRGLVFSLAGAFATAPTAAVCWSTLARKAAEEKRERNDRDKHLLVRTLSRTIPMSRLL